MICLAWKKIVFKTIRTNIILQNRSVDIVEYMKNKQYSMQINSIHAKLLTFCTFYVGNK
jgi:hypothetical protein